MRWSGNMKSCETRPTINGCIQPCQPLDDLRPTEILYQAAFNLPRTPISAGQFVVAYSPDQNAESRLLGADGDSRIPLPGTV